MTVSLSPLQPILLTLAIGLIPNSAVALEITDKVVRVLDGDTIEVLHNGKAERIRLNGIDCPEKGHAYGKRAKQAASEVVFGKDVTLNTFGKDKYGGRYPLPLAPSNLSSPPLPLQCAAGYPCNHPSAPRS
jgi:endonuclease YncB( thermonuclease family)